MGIRFGPQVCWRVSQRGLLIGGVEGDALLLEHPRAADLPAMLGDLPDAAVLAARLGEPNGPALVDEMLDTGVLTEQDHDGERPGPERGVVLTRSGAEFPGIERPAQWLDRRVVPLLLSWPGRALLAGCVVSGVVALLAGRPDGPTVSAHPALDALLGLAIVLGCSALHELAHAVALVHYGRRPRRAGFGFYWGGISFYVDSTEALTLPRRRRVVQALVGLAVDVVTVSLLALVAQLSSIVLLVAVCWRLAVLGVADLVVNLLPFLELDGHWALADHLDEPELAPRARAALGEALRHAPRRPPWLAVYGAVSLLGGLALLVGSAAVWWAAAADLVRALFTGDLLEIIVGVVLVGPVVLSLLVSAAGLLLETVLAPVPQPAPP